LSPRSYFGQRWRPFAMIHCDDSWPLHKNGASGRLSRVAERIGKATRAVKSPFNTPSPRRVKRTDFPDDTTHVRTKRVVSDIQPGRFTQDWMPEDEVNQRSFKATRAKSAAHPIEEVGARLRAMMPWIGANKLIDKDEN
jgi:hypothetical protein